MRVRVLVESFDRDDPASWVHALDAVINRAHQGDDPDAALAVEAITHAAADPSLAYLARQRLYEAAAWRGLPAIARLFLSASPATASQSQLDKQLAPERPLRPTDRPLTLGERKALARTHRRDKLTLLLRDPHPEVVAILLDNPHITEPEIVRIASGRPAVPESLAKIAAHHRWSVRHAVKRALVQNPMTPLADAIRIATTLGVRELDQLAQDPALPEPLRRHAADLRDSSMRRSRA
ncbi:MAG: hypothetical protein AB7L28_24435 [Kofleriaceae bacterium]